MINEHDEELAALHAFDLLEGEERRAFEAQLAKDPELQDYCNQMTESAAQMALQSPLRQPPPELEGKVLAAVRSDRKIIPMPAPTPTWIPWALAAGLAVTSALLFADRAKLHQQVAQLQHRDVLAQTQIATLSSKLASAPQASAVIVWDEEKQQGVLKVLDTPATAADKDYQLWIVDPNRAQPVNGGVFSVGRSGATKISFRPDTHVSGVKAFAVSLERKGGVPKAEGPMVLVGK